MYEYIRLDSNLTKAALQPETSLAFYQAILTEESKKHTQDTNSALDPTDLIIAVGAHLNQTPVGVAIAALNKSSTLAHIRTLFIAENHPQEEIGVTLMTKLIAELKREKTRVTTLVYVKEHPATPTLEKILTASGWKGPRPFMKRCFFDLESFDTPWLHYDTRYPKGFHEFFWRSLTTKDKAILQKRESNNEFPSAVSPFINEDSIEMTNSLGIKGNGKVVGWIICHRISPDTVRFSSFYIDPALRDRELTIKLLANSIQLVLKRPPFKWAQFEVPDILTDANWRQFVKKRLEGETVKVIHLMQAWHDM